MTQIPLSILHYLFLTTSLFCIGLCGIISNRTNLLIILICIEVVLFSIVINFVIFAVYLDDMCGIIFALFVLTVAASESAIGLAIVVVSYRLQDNIVLPPIGVCGRFLGFKEGKKQFIFSLNMFGYMVSILEEFSTSFVEISSSDNLYILYLFAGLLVCFILTQLEWSLAVCALCILVALGFNFLLFFPHGEGFFWDTYLVFLVPLICVVAYIVVNRKHPKGGLLNTLDDFVDDLGKLAEQLLKYETVYFIYKSLRDAYKARTKPLTLWEIISQFFYCVIAFCVLMVKIFTVAPFIIGVSIGFCPKHLQVQVIFIISILIGLVCFLSQNPSFVKNSEPYLGTDFFKKLGFGSYAEIFYGLQAGIGSVIVCSVISNYTPVIIAIYNKYILGLDEIGLDMTSPEKTSPKSTVLDKASPEKTSSESTVLYKASPEKTSSESKTVAYSLRKLKIKKYYTDKALKEAKTRLLNAQAAGVEAEITIKKLVIKQNKADIAYRYAEIRLKDAQTIDAYVETLKKLGKFTGGAIVFGGTAKTIETVAKNPDLIQTELDQLQKKWSKPKDGIDDSKGAGGSSIEKDEPKRPSRWWWS